MSYSSTVASEQLDYGFLLLTHIVCADQQIHSEESKYLRELGDRAAPAFGRPRSAAFGRSQ